MMRSVVVAVFLMMAGVNAWADFTGTSKGGAFVKVSPLRPGGNAPLNREEVKELEKGYGGDLTLALVEVDNRNGQESFSFRTSCCNSALAFRGTNDPVLWVNLRDVAISANIRPSAAGQFADQEIPKGSQGSFVVGWDGGAVKSLNNMVGVSLQVFEYCLVECM